jgi:hypothetical protein
MFTKQAGVLAVTTSYTSNSPSTTVELKPSYNIPLVLVIAAIPMLVVQPWVGGAIALFGLFLILKTCLEERCPRI